MTVAEKRMEQAAADFHATNENSISEVCDEVVSCDETWQKRGFSSLTGVVPVISHRNGKVSNFVVLTKYCKEYEYWSHRDHDSTEYHEWKLQHYCKANYTGSSPSMESSGAVQLWGRSVEKRKIQYSKMIADEDSKSHSNKTKQNHTEILRSKNCTVFATFKKEWVLVSVNSRKRSEKKTGRWQIYLWARKAY